MGSDGGGFDVDELTRLHGFDGLEDRVFAVEGLVGRAVQLALAAYGLEEVFEVRLMYGFIEYNRDGEGRERGAFDFESVAQSIVDKLIRRHPHVFGETKVKDVAQVWANWEKIKRAEKHGTRHARPSAFDGIPKRLPALLRAEKLLKKARRTKLSQPWRTRRKFSRRTLGEQLFYLAQYAQTKGWCAEDLLRTETRRRERELRKREKKVR